MNTRSSSNWNINQTSNKAIDSDINTNWQVNVSRGFNNSLLAVDFRVHTTSNKVRLTEYDQSTTSYRIEYWNESNWLIAYMELSINSEGVSFTSVTGNQMRVVFTSGIGYSPIVYEHEVYNSTLTDISQTVFRLFNKV